MSNMIEIIKKAAIDAVEQTKPLEIMYATVEGIDPIRIKINQKLMLGPPHVARLYHTDDLKTGDIVAVLRYQSGQKFLILDKVVD